MYYYDQRSYTDDKKLYTNVNKTCSWTFLRQGPTFSQLEQMTHHKAHKMEKDLSNDRVVCVGWRQRVGKIGESMATCGFSYMGQRGARGQSLRASWQWQHQCQTLEEERTCMMVSPKLWRYGSRASLLGLGGLSSFTKFKLETVRISPANEMIGCAERLPRPNRG